MKRTRRDAFTLVELLVVIAIIGTLMSLLLPAVQAVRESGRKTKCKANLAQHVKAMQIRHDTHGSYPAGLDAYTVESGLDPWEGHTGWVHLLNYLDQMNVYKEYDFQHKATDVENKLARSQSIPVFLCPTDDSDRKVTHKRRESGEFSRSNYALCFGSETMAQHWKKKETDGAFRIGKARKERDFQKKGKTMTVMVSELIAGTKDEYTSNSYDLRGVWALPGMGSFAYTHYNVPNSDEPDLMRFESDRKFCIDRPVMPCADEDQGTDEFKYRVSARSRHPGGLHVGYADERVEWVSNTIDRDTWRRMGSLANERLEDRDEDEEFKVRSIDRF